MTATVVLLASLSAAIATSLQGMPGAIFTLKGGNALYTVAPDCSIDGGDTWDVPGRFVRGAVATKYETIRPGQKKTEYRVICPFGSSNVRLRVIAYTSGGARWTVRVMSEEDFGMHVLPLQQKRP